MCCELDLGSEGFENRPASSSGVRAYVKDMSVILEISAMVALCLRDFMRFIMLRYVSEGENTGFLTWAD